MLTVNVELLLVVPVTVIRSPTASLPEPVNVVLVALIVNIPLVAVKLISLPVILVRCDLLDINVVLVCAIVVFIQYYVS